MTTVGANHAKKHNQQVLIAAGKISVAAAGGPAARLVSFSAGLKSNSGQPQAIVMASIPPVAAIAPVSTDNSIGAPALGIGQVAQ